MTETQSTQRLSDRILNALELALDQNRRTIAELLLRALDLSMARGVDGVDFTERREVSPAIIKALKRLESLRKPN